MSSARAPPPPNNPGPSGHDFSPAICRVVPCLLCLWSALAGSSLGDCWDEPDQARYEWCNLGGSCTLVPLAARLVALFFLDFLASIGDNLARSQKTELAKRRAAVKVVLKGCADGTFPSVGDLCLA
ncbi:unnamed protein product [Fusarium langsethiae]|nr:unnamed protein product [Fusarium langsethiae]